MKCVSAVDGQSGIPAPKAQVLSATATELVVKVPELVKTGKITLRTINGQSQSPTDFTVTPTISSLEQSCLGVGDTLVIHGSGFTGSGNGGLHHHWQWPRTAGRQTEPR
ncbi:MAG: hypothetical protein R2867_09925 [Caldilineaceae bacterium]